MNADTEPTASAPINALREGVAFLRAAIQPTETKIAELEAEVAETRGQLARWERALGEAQGRAAGSPMPSTRRTPRSATAITASAEQLVAWMRACDDDDGWVAAADVRAALDVPETVPGPKLTAWLAATTGVESNGAAGRARKYRAAR